ncbi:MAG: hypothetical protein KF784_09985 [Fimbriimonadaceae bacterium]|nr:hypothetical protein [Fimbriimonadaceae bacterium]
MSKTFLTGDHAHGASSYLHTLQPVEDAVDAARRQGSTDLRTKFKSELDGMLKQAQEDGFHKGYEDGYRTGRLEGQQAVADEQAEYLARFQAELNEARDTVIQSIDRWYEAAEPELAELAVYIASRIVGNELTTNPEVILGITKEALAEITNTEKVRIRVNPFDSPTLNEHKASLMAISPSVRQVEIIEDPSITGGCLIESDSGAADATVQTKVEAILNTLRGEAA